MTCRSLLLAALAFSASSALAQPAPLRASDLAAIRATSDAFVKAVVASNFEAVAALYTEKASLMPPNSAIVAGRPAILAFFKGFPKVTAMDFDLPEIEGRGDLAFVRGVYRMTMMPPGATAPVSDTGKFLEIRRRDKDGAWKIAVDIFNSDLPAAH